MNKTTPHRIQLTRRNALFMGVATLSTGIPCLKAASTTAPASAPTTAPNRTPCRELVLDRHFRQGFQLLEPKVGNRVVYGRLPGLEHSADPVWDLAQWSSRFPLKPNHAERLPDGGLRFANDGKSVTIGPTGSEYADLSLGVAASAEYGQRARKVNEPWVHLLASQRFANPPSIGKIAAAHFHLDSRLKYSRHVMTDDYSPGRHAAHIQVFLTVQNLNTSSRGYRTYLWFGLPLYDDRHRLPPAYKAQDKGDTKMFIYTCAAEELTHESAHDRKWVTIDRDLMPLIRQAMETTWSRGFLDDSHKWDDYHISGINLGWEVPGIFDVEMQVRDLSLCV